jgi:hypothetical protein
MSVYAREIPFVTNKSGRSGVFAGSVGQYVGVPLEMYEQLLSCIYFSSSFPFVIVSLEPHWMLLQL